MPHRFSPDFKGGSCVPLKKSLRTLFEDFFFFKLRTFVERNKRLKVSTGVTGFNITWPLSCAVM